MKKNAGKLLDILICALLGAVVFLFLYGPDSLHVTFDWWILNGYVEEDIVQHYTGWMAFRDSAWHFPLGVTDRIGYPVGAVISFTDSLPLVSVFLKCISGILPETFQFFGWYVLGCFILQSVAAGLLTGLFTKKRWGVYGMSLLFSFAPIFVERAFRHTALASHWLLLFALFFYFKARKDRKIPWGFLVLSFLTVGLHPYFLPMVFGVLAVWTLEQVFGAKGRRIKALGFFLVNVLLTLAVGYVLGIFGSGVEGASGGFGYYSMNLNALWNPTSKGIETWSRWLPVLPQMAGNYDGFNYLGAGVLFLGSAAVLIKIAAWIREKRLGAILKSYGWLLLFLAGCTLFALSNVIVYGERELLTIPLPEVILQICSIFRASGRLFYPVYYMMFLAAGLACIQFGDGQGAFVKKELRIWKVPVGFLLFALLLAVQLVDLSPAIEQKQKSIDAEHIEAGFYNADLHDSAEWKEVLAAYDRAELLTYHHDYTTAAFFMKNHVQSNILPTNRGDFVTAEERCSQMILELYAGSAMEENVLYLTNDRVLAEQLSWNLHEDMTAYQLGEYVGFGHKKEGLQVPLAEFTSRKNTFAAIAKDSPDWLYLVGTEDDELLLPYTEILGQAIEQGSRFCKGEEELEILSSRLYTHEFIRKYLYVQVRLEEGQSLSEWKHADNLQIR